LAQAKNSGIVSAGDLKSIGRIVTKNWYIPVISIAICFGAGYLYSYKLTDIFAAKTQILLHSNNDVNPSSIIGETFYGGSQSFIDNTNETRVIRSYDLIKTVLERVDFNVSYFLVGRIKTMEVFDGMPFRVKVLNINPGLYEQQMKFKITDKDHFRITYLKAGKEENRIGSFDKEFTEADFRLLVTRVNNFNNSPVETLKGMNYLMQIHNPANQVYQFQANLEVKTPDFTNILEITMQDVIPERAVIFLDTLSKVYIENTMKSRLEMNANTMRYIDRQMGEVTGLLNSIEDTMQGFKEKHAILDLTREGNTYFNKMDTYDAEKVNMGLQISILNDLENYIIADKDPEFLPPSLYVIKDDGFLSRAVGELYNLQLSRNGSLSTAKEGSPGIVELDKRIDALRKNLLVYIGNLRTAIKQKITETETEIQTYISDIKGLPQKQRGLLNIQRKMSVNEGMYVFLLQKRASTVIAKASIMPETKIIESARSIGIVKPDRKKVISGFMFFGFGLAVSIIAIRHFFFARIESVEELKAKTSLPVIGEVIFVPTIKELIIAAESEPKSPIAEAFRTIRTNLQYMSTAPGCKTIVITSNNPGEGKTFCSLNLAGILAKAGKKVLILELDLHKPRVQRGLGLEADIGISTIVIGKNTIEECIKHTVIENLDAILSGPLPPNPSEIILTKELEAIIQYGKANYDYLIVDTPPVGLISDAIMLMKMADISLFVLNTTFPFKESIENAHEIKEMNKLGHFGFILNGVKRRRSRYYYNRYSYGTGYGYGGYGSYGSYGNYGNYGNYGGYGGGYGNGKNVNKKS
jgi:capsular exopolysaccharide synthesis family protein